ncbi:MAG TPA: flagellar basal body protein [Tepidisphaeraceae bacterium]|nr:flagellar basal body protein [Tepidisphaeraceae bacterium]
MFDSLDISASALLAQRTWMDTIAGNIANVDTPGYRQKDLSVQRFSSMLRERVDDRRRSGSASFDDIAMKTENPVRGILFHDRNNRSMEHLATDLAKNAMMHNLAIELLRKQFQQMEMALKEKVV